MVATLQEPVRERVAHQGAPATFYTVAGVNDTTWRVGIPAQALGAKVVKIPQKTGERELNYPNLDGAFRWYLTDSEESVYPDHEGGCAVWTRPDQTRAIHATAMYDQGVRIVAEVDDNYLAHPKYNPFMRRHYTTSTREEIKRAYAPFDHVIVTTQWLRDSFAAALRKFGVRPLPEFHICGNHISEDMWMEPAPYDGPVRVGWMGSDSHWRDVRLAYPALKAASDAGCEVVFVGFNPNWLPQCGAPWSEGIPKTAWGFPYRHIGWVDPNLWKREPFPIDIGVAPLERNEFTLGKSDVKILDYALSGAAVVACDTVYGDSIVHGETGLLTKSRQLGSVQNELWGHVKTLIGEPKMRAELAQNLRQYVRENRMIEQPQNIGPWKEAIGNV